MHLIFGGAYQGKLDYAKERYGLSDQDVFVCEAGDGEGSGPLCAEIKECPEKARIDFNKKIVCRLEDFVLGCVRRGEEAVDFLSENRRKWKDTVFICTDISSGVVPVEPELRAWREMVGRTLVYLGKEAEEVTRMFCGIPQKIK
jgi:adenosyl cobinamide kinase/adenosyl cobinamide phosphate guanylyltransferase